MTDHSSHPDLSSPRKPKRKAVLIARRTGFVIVGILLLSLITVAVFPELLVNRFFKERVTNAFADAFPAYTLQIGSMGFSVITNNFSFDSLAVSSHDGTLSGSIGSVSLSGIDWMHLLWRATFEAADFSGIDLNARDVAVNLRRVHYQLRCKQMHISLRDSSVEIESAAAHQAGGDEQVLRSGSVGTVAMSGIEWMRLLRKATVDEKDFSNIAFEARDIVVSLAHAHYELRSKRVRISVPDSSAEIESVNVRPSSEDEQFFRKSKFRTTRFIAVIPQSKISGLACLDLIQGRSYRARSATIRDAVLDVLVNKDKPNIVDLVAPLMPNEILASIKKTVHVATVEIVNATLLYRERFAVGAPPAVIAFEQVHIQTDAIGNRLGRTAALALDAQWVLAGEGVMKVRMSIPWKAPGFSCKYSGSITTMNLSALNSFLEVSDQVRITSGILHEAAFEITIAAGQAHGTIQGVYTGLTVSTLEEKSTGGVSNFFKSLLANTFKIRRNSVRDNAGLLPVGKINYTRERTDPFISLVWFSLRTGVRNVVGF